MFSSQARINISLTTSSTERPSRQVSGLGQANRDGNVAQLVGVCIHGESPLMDNGTGTNKKPSGTTTGLSSHVRETDHLGDASDWSAAKQALGLMLEKLLETAKGGRDA